MKRSDKYASVSTFFCHQIHYMHLLKTKTIKYRKFNPLKFRLCTNQTNFQHFTQHYNICRNVAVCMRYNLNSS